VLSIPLSELSDILIPELRNAQAIEAVNFDEASFTGTYMYNDGSASVEFTITFNQNGDQITGTVYDDGGRRATFEGSIIGNLIEFVKTYDDSPDSPITYYGTVYPDQNMMTRRMGNRKF